MKKLIVKTFFLIVGMSCGSLSHAMELTKQEKREEKRDKKLQKDFEAKIGLSNPKRISHEFLLEVINESKNIYILEANKKAIGSALFPDNKWTHKVPLYRVTNNLSAFEGYFRENQKNISAMISISLAKNSDLKTNTLTADLIIDPSSEEHMPFSQDILLDSNYKIVVTLNQDKYKSAVSIQPMEKSPKGSLVQRVISSSKMHIQKEDKASEKN